MPGRLEGGPDTPGGTEVGASSPERRPGARFALAALAFSLAALVASWNPIAAPFGLIVGAASLALAFRALARSSRRGVAWAALGIAGAAVLVSAAVLALTAGVGRNLGKNTIVPTPPARETEQKLDSAAEQDRAARARARKELEGLGPSEGNRERGQDARRPAHQGDGR
jgi:hypothetical protein